MFTNTWFDNARPMWEVLVRPRIQPGAKILEIGSYEGKSACWFAEANPEGTVTCVDTWQGSEEHDKKEMPAVHQRFLDNTARFTNIVPIQSTSRLALTRLASEQKLYDVVYVDGSHHSADVLSDAVLAFQLTRVGGIIIFDDYGWGSWHNPAEAHHAPRIAIDAFLFSHKDDVKILHREYQVVVEKLQERE